MAQGNPQAGPAEGPLFAEVVRRYEEAARMGEAVAHHREGRDDQARAAYESVLAVNPGHVPALNNLSLLVPPDLAEHYLRRALAIDSGYADAIINLANILVANGRYHEALILLPRALNTAPDDLRVILLLCRTYEALDAFQAAIDLLEAKKTLFDSLADVYCQIGKFYESMGQTDKALSYLSTAVQMDPNNVEAHVYAGRQYLTKGDYVRGAEGIGWIWHGVMPSQVGLFVDEAGQPIRQNGNVVALSVDTGLGDTLQFVRYGRLLRQLGPRRLIVECQPELVRLLRNMPEFDAVYPRGTLEARVDHRVPMHNLIGAFRTTPQTVPAPIPYLRADPAEAEEYRRRVADYPGLRVGLCWSGSPDHPRNASRSISPVLLAPLTALSGVTFFSLQKDGNAQGLPIVDWSQEFHDFARTAALVEALDMVITVDSAVAHLAGGLGKPVWLLNRFDTCWRWGQTGSTTPWYPNLTQFRQRQPGQWSTVLNAVTMELASVACRR